MNITETLRVRRYDERNVVIEEYTTTVNPRTKEEASKWKLVGYYPTVSVAIQAILDKGMLIEHEQIETLTAYQKAAQKQHDELMQTIEREALLERIMDLELENKRLREGADEWARKTSNSGRLV